MSKLPASPALDFKALFESVPGLYLILAPDADFTIVAVSDTYLSATMTLREAILGRKLFEVFPDNPDDPGATGTSNLRASLGRVLTHRVPDAMPVQKYDIRKPASEGGGFEVRYWNPVNSPWLDKDGTVLSIIHCVEDVTELVLLNRQHEEQAKETEKLRAYSQDMEKKAYLLAQANERKLKSLVDTVLDTMVDGVITINMEGQIQSYNKACAKLFGYLTEEVAGKNVNMLMPEPYRGGHDRYLENYRKTGIAKIIGVGREVQGLRKDGSVFPMELAVGATLQGGEHAYVGVIRDITERKEAEKAREQLRQAQKMESIGQLTGGIAHDFNNLLAVIIGNLDFLVEMTPEHDPLRKFIAPTVDAALQGSELTQRLLAFGRKQTLQPKVTSLNDLVVHFSTLVKRTLGERIDISMSLAPGLWNVSVDPHQLENALLNLSVNARDAMPEGGKLIYETRNLHLDEGYATLNPEVIPGDYVLVAVSDTGSGMTPEIMEKAFEPFFTTKDVGKGSGLGLSMVYGFVKQSAGHIKLYSEPGHGTSVKIYLPRIEGTVRPVTEEKKIPATPASRSVTVLVVEDNKNVLELTSSMVKSLSYTILTAETGQDALDILVSKQQVDLLLTDVMLPGAINGPVLARRAGELRPGLKVLFNSGYAEHAIFEIGLLKEGVHLIPKPFRKAQLGAKIEEVLKS